MKNQFLFSLFLLIFIPVILSGLSTSFSEHSLLAADTEMPNNTEHVDVNIKLFTFKPEVLEIPVGKTVVWTNGDAIEHSITQGTPDNPGPEFDSGFFTKGDTYSFTFTEVGEYDYFCKRHNSMRGRIKVTE